MGYMATRSEILTKFFSILRDYGHGSGLSFSSSPEDLLQRSEKMSLRYDLDLGEVETSGLYIELADAFGFDPGDFYEYYSPAVGDLVRLVLSKVDVD